MAEFGFLFVEREGPSRFRPEWGVGRHRPNGCLTYKRSVGFIRVLLGQPRWVRRDFRAVSSNSLRCLGLSTFLDQNLL